MGHAQPVRDRRRYRDGAVRGSGQVRAQPQADRLRHDGNRGGGHLAPPGRPVPYQGSGGRCWWRSFLVSMIRRLRRDSSHSWPLSSRVVLADLTSPAAATAIATLAAVTSSGASYTTSPSYSPNGKPPTQTLAPSSSSVGAIASMGSCGSVS